MDDDEEIFIPGEKDLEEAEEIERELSKHALKAMKGALEQMPEEERKKVAEDFDNRLRELAMTWPDNLLTPPECDLVVENWGALSFQGYGDIRRGMQSQVYREAVKGMDLDECSDFLGDTVKISEIPKTINLCLVIKIEELVKQKLIDDGHDPDDVSDSSLYWNSPLDVGWTSPHEHINEAAMKIMREE